MITTYLYSRFFSFHFVYNSPQVLIATVATLYSIGVSSRLFLTMFGLIVINLITLASLYESSRTFRLAFRERDNAKNNWYFTT